MVYPQHRIRLGKWDEQNCLGFWDTNWSSKLGQMTRPIDSQQKKKRKRTCHGVKLEESENWCKYLDFTRDLEELWNIFGTFITVTNLLINWLENLEKRGRVERLQTTALVRSARILRRVLETWCPSNSRGKSSANAGVNNSQMSKIILLILWPQNKTERKWKEGWVPGPC